jgi:hypothetical protein
MDTVILAPGIIVRKEILEKKKDSKMDQIDILIAGIEIPEKRFGIVDLWNIRRRGRYSTVSRNII